MTRDKMLDTMDMASSSSSHSNAFRRRTMATTEIKEMIANQGCDPIEILNMSSSSKDILKPATVCMPTTRRMSIGAEMIMGDGNREKNDWEEERLDIEGFVIDYFLYKMNQNGYEWFDAPQLPYGTQPEHLMMRAIATIFEQQNKQRLEGFAEQLILSPRVSFSLYQEVVQTVGWAPSDTCQMSYGRLIGLVAFGGVVAQQMMEKMEMRDQIIHIARYTSLFIKTRLRASWKQHDKSWSDFMELGVKLKKKYILDEAEQIAIARRRRRFSIFGLSAAAVLGFVVGGRFIFGAK